MRHRGTEEGCAGCETRSPSGKLNGASLASCCVADGARGTALEVLVTLTRLGLTSFGGPVEHLGYFRSECVELRRWLNDTAYPDHVALCQFLPGPAWLGFTLPSAVLLIAFAFGVQALATTAGAAWLDGLKLVAVAVVALLIALPLLREANLARAVAVADAFYRTRHTKGSGAPQRANAGAACVTERAVPLGFAQRSPRPQVRINVRGAMAASSAC